MFERFGKRATILADSQDAASLPNSSPYAAFAMTDMCELQLERGALVLRGFDDLLAAHAELVPANAPRLLHANEDRCVK